MYDPATSTFGASPPLHAPAFASLAPPPVIYGFGGTVATFVGDPSATFTVDAPKKKKSIVGPCLLFCFACVLLFCFLAWAIAMTAVYAARHEGEGSCELSLLPSADASVVTISASRCNALPLVCSAADLTSCTTVPVGLREGAPATHARQSPGAALVYLVPAGANSVIALIKGGFATTEFSPSDLGMPFGAPGFCSGNKCCAKVPVGSPSGVATFLTCVPFAGNVSSSAIVMTVLLVNGVPSACAPSALVSKTGGEGFLTCAALGDATGSPASSTSVPIRPAPAGPAPAALLPWETQTKVVMPPLSVWNPNTESINRYPMEGIFSRSFTRSSLASLGVAQASYSVIFALYTLDTNNVFIDGTTTVSALDTLLRIVLSRVVGEDLMSTLYTYVPEDTSPATAVLSTREAGRTGGAAKGVTFDVYSFLAEVMATNASGGDVVKVTQRWQQRLRTAASTAQVTANAPLSFLNVLANALNPYYKNSFTTIRTIGTPTPPTTPTTDAGICDISADGSQLAGLTPGTASSIRATATGIACGDWLSNEKFLDDYLWRGPMSQFMVATSSTTFTLDLTGASGNALLDAVVKNAPLLMLRVKVLLVATGGDVAVTSVTVSGGDLTAPVIVTPLYVSSSSSVKWAAAMAATSTLANFIFQAYHVSAHVALDQTASAVLQTTASSSPIFRILAPHLAGVGYQASALSTTLLAPESVASDSFFGTSTDSYWTITPGFYPALQAVIYSWYSCDNLDSFFSPNPCNGTAVLTRAQMQTLHGFAGVWEHLQVIDDFAESVGAAYGSNSSVLADLDAVETKLNSFGVYGATRGNTTAERISRLIRCVLYNGAAWHSATQVRWFATANVHSNSVWMSQGTGCLSAAPLVAVCDSSTERSFVNFIYQSVVASGGPAGNAILNHYSKELQRFGAIAATSGAVGWLMGDPSTYFAHGEILELVQAFNANVTAAKAAVKTKYGVLTVLDTGLGRAFPAQYYPDADVETFGSKTGLTAGTYY